MIGLLQKPGWKSWLLYLAIVFCFFILVLIIGDAVYGSNYRNRIISGVHIGKIDLSGLSKQEAEMQLAKNWDTFNENGILLHLNDQSVPLTPQSFSSNGDAGALLIDFDTEMTVSNAFIYGHTTNPITNTLNHLSTYLFGRAVEPTFSMNQSAISTFLHNAFAKQEMPAKNAKLAFTTTANNADFTITPEQSGKIIDEQALFTDLELNLRTLSTQTIELKLIESAPLVNQIDLLAVKSEAEQYLALTPIKLKSTSTSWKIDGKRLGSWITSSRANQTDTAQIGLDLDQIKKYLREQVAAKIDQPAADARFLIQGGRVTQFQQSKVGKVVDIDATAASIEANILAMVTSTIPVSIKIVTGLDNSASSTDNLGITELLGTGQSNFSGSPANRRHNIKTGAFSLNGLLIKPGDTFSVVKNLGSLDAAGGYLPELVIKGNKTTPEYGGGLCQVGTTMFRTAIEAGLPIVERRNHSYRVSYYEPAGTDATIYDPSPDFKFLNDTGNYILIQARMSGNMLYFDFWGTKDGRIAKHTYPSITNIVKPQPTKIIETTDLPVGQKKCIEKAHNGADASFNYSVTYLDGSVKEKQFNSHYTPWREVCLLGVKELSSATSTTSILPVNSSTSSSNKTNKATST
ncbi:MAG: VanW family protein [Candidatus Falkowbacteria bacterium]